MGVNRIVGMLRDSVLMRMALTLAIGVSVIVLGARGLGIHFNMLTSAFVTMPIYLVLESLLASGPVRAERIQSARRMLRESWPRAGYFAVLLALTALAIMARTEPGAPFPRYVQSLVEYIGLPMVLGMPLLRVFFSAGSGYASFSSMMGQVILGLAALSVVLFFIGVSGDTVYLAIIQNPDEASVAGVALLICLLVVKLAAPGVPVPRDDLNYGMGGTALALAMGAPTERDGQYIAAHEAGHALVYAALGALPADIKLVLNEKADARGALGFITNVKVPHRLPEARFVEWYLHMLLAGKAGEAAVHGTATLGGAKDHQRWLREATTFLASQENGVFYVNPQSKLELEHNEAKLDALKAQQQETLRRFFAVNADIHQALAQDLREQRTMEREALLPYLSRVKMVAGMPLPYGEFTAFGGEVLVL